MDLCDMFDDIVKEKYTFINSFLEKSCKMKKFKDKTV
jgi:hypothetical protein